MPEHHLFHDTATAAATHAGELSASTYDYPPPVDRLQLPSRPAIPALLAPSAAPAASVPRRLSRPSLSPNPLAASTSSSPSPSQSPSRSPLRSRYHLPRTSSLLPPPRSPTQLDRLRTDSPSGSASSAQQGPQPTIHQQPYPYTAKSTALAASPLRDPEARRPQLSSSARPGSADSAELLNNELRETTETSRADHSQPSTEYEPRFTPLPPLELLPALDNSIGEPLASLLGQPTAPGFEPQGTPQGPPQDKMPHDHPRESNASSRHSKRRSSRSSGHDTEKPKSAKGPSQKAMLSRALQKANTAVQLDNAQNLEGARLAYAEACDLLQQVLRRTTADEDKRKLEAIVSSNRATKMTKIAMTDITPPPPIAPNIRQPHRGARSNGSLARTGRRGQSSTRTSWQRRRSTGLTGPCLSKRCSCYRMERDRSWAQRRSLLFISPPSRTESNTTTIIVSPPPTFPRKPAKYPSQPAPILLFPSECPPEICRYGYAAKARV